MNDNRLFEISRQNKIFFLKIINELTIEQINVIPNGFNNNIVWNFAHIIATPQVLCYKLAQLPSYLQESFVDTYKKGTKPSGFVNAEALENIKNLGEHSFNQLIIDYENNIFDNYKPYVTSMQVELKNIDDALAYSCMHDGLHLGYVMALRRLVAP